jgi:lipoprotein-anchoring transpeptidase ErfK/SrfK
MLRTKIIFALVFLLSITATVTSAYAQCTNCYLSPQVERLLPNEHLLTSGNYYQVLGAVDVVDAPNGNVVLSRPEGSYYVSVRRFQDGWAEINENQWLPANILVPASVSRFGGVLLSDAPTEYPIAWVRQTTFASSAVGISPIEDEASALAQYTLVNIFSQQSVDDVEWVEAGENQWLPRAMVAMVDPIERPAEIDTQRWTAVDLAEQVLYAYDGDQVVFATMISSGYNVTPTHEGFFHVYVRYRSTPMTNVTDPAFFYYLEDVPWTMYFNGDQALHGAYWQDNFGTRGSHGCVNLSLTDAYWLYNFFAEQIDLTADEVTWPAVYIYRHGS